MRAINYAYDEVGNRTSIATIRLYRLNIALDGTGGGTVANEALDISCTSDCSMLIAEGTLFQ